MEWLKNGFAPVVAAAMLLLPGALVAQPPARDAAPVNPEVSRLTFRGVKALDVDDLRKSIATDASHCLSSIFIPLCWITKANYVYVRKFLNRDELARDILRARVFYWKRGYRDTQVDTVVTSINDKNVHVTFLVNEGQPTIVRDITVTQTQPVLTDKEIAGRMVIEENSPLNVIRLDSSLVFLQQKLWDKGYADALVDTTVAIDTTTKNATIAISLNPRWKATVSDILIEGNDEISTRTILNSIALHPGDLFQRSKLLHSQRALYESNLFQRAAIEVPRQGDSSKVLIVSVVESPHREARASAGFNTVDFFQVEGRFTHYNFFRGARRLDAQGAMGNLLASSINGRFIFRDALRNVRTDRDRYLAPTYTASLNLRQPWFRAHENELALGVFAHRRSAPGVYVDRGFGTSSTFTRELAERMSASLNYRFEINQVDAGDVYFCVNYGICDQPTLGAIRGNQRLSPFALSSNINRANDPFSPSVGYRATAEVEHASAFTLSDFRHNRAFADAAVFRPVRKRGVLAGHLRLGWIQSLASTAGALGVEDMGALLHPRKRFYAGGSRSVRGYGENQLGPRVLTIPASTLRKQDPGCVEGVDLITCDPNAEGLDRLDFDPRPLGGNVVAEASVEFRFPVWKQVVGAVFLDGGYVAQRINPALPRSRAAITPGFGGRYRSPVGPIRVDIGINPGLAETLPVVTEAVVNGETRLVTLAERRRFSPLASGARGIFDRMILHLSIGEAF